jgi:hypothetical protein
MARIKGARQSATCYVSIAAAGRYQDDRRHNVTFLKYGSAVAVSRDEPGTLRQAFLARVRDDHLRLTMFAAALTDTKVDADSIFENLRMFAHRVRGAASIFTVNDVADAAYALERATDAALIAHADRSDAAVSKALAALVSSFTNISARRATAPAQTDLAAF